MATYQIDTSELCGFVEKLRAGDTVYLSGIVYTARDAAHKKIKALLDSGSPLPFDLKNAVIYYAGPTPEKPGRAIGSCGPTTSSRMDIYTPQLLQNGLLAMIGKGKRSTDVISALINRKGVYFCAIGGAGALASKCITSCQIIAFPELGCESVKKLTFLQFPLYVGIDCLGGSLFKD